MVGLNKQSSFYFWDFMNLFWVSFYRKLLRQAIGWYHFFISSTARRGLVGHWQNSFRELERGRVRVWGGKVTKQVNKPTLSLKTAMCRWFLILDWWGGQLSKQTLL